MIDTREPQSEIIDGIPADRYVATIQATEDVDLAGDEVKELLREAFDVAGRGAPIIGTIEYLGLDEHGLHAFAAWLPADVPGGSNGIPISEYWALKDAEKAAGR